jgi:hypothetical protein
LAVLSALLSRVVEQWLSSRTHGPGFRAMAHRLSSEWVNDFPGCARTGCGGCGGVRKSEAGISGGAFGEHAAGGVMVVVHFGGGRAPRAGAGRGERQAWPDAHKWQEPATSASHVKIAKHRG